jgi:hypothetical protein
MQILVKFIYKINIVDFVFLYTSVKVRQQFSLAVQVL